MGCVLVTLFPEDKAIWAWSLTVVFIWYRVQDAWIPSCVPHSFIVFCLMITSASACFPTHDITRSFPFVELMFAQCTTYKMSAVACFRSNRFTSTKSPSFCLTIFGGSLTKLTALLRPSHVLSYHVNRRILAPAPPPPSPPPHCFQKHSDISAHDFAHPPAFWH